MPYLEEESRCRLSFRLRRSTGLRWMQQEEVPHLRKEKDRRAAAGRIMWDGARSGYVSYSVMEYGYAPNRKPIRRKTQRRVASERAPQPVLTA